MRLLLISCVVVCAGLAASPAAAYYGSKRGYASCFCSFGYSGHGTEPPKPICIPAVSCAAEGGRCTKRCPRQHQ
jgi:hypothetical protein